MLLKLKQRKNKNYLQHIHVEFNPYHCFKTLQKCFWIYLVKKSETGYKQLEETPK